MAEKNYFVIKNGLVHNCKTEERYKSFIEDGWTKYTPPKEPKTPKDNEPPKEPENN